MHDGDNANQSLHRRLYDHLRREFGTRGGRAVEFLMTAASILARHEVTPAPRDAETVAYCLREALKELPQVAVVDEERWRALSRRIVEGRRAYEHAAGAAEADRDILLQRLLAAISDLERFHEQEAVHQRRLLELIRRKTGQQPLRQARDPIAEYRQLLDRLDQAAHGSLDADRSQALYDAAHELLHRLLPPPELPLEELEQLAALTAPTEADRDRLVEVATSPHHLFVLLLRGPFDLVDLAAAPNRTVGSTGGGRVVRTPPR